MKRMAFFLVLVMLVHSLTACILGANKPEQVEAMFDSFNQSTDYVLLTHFELVVKGEHYKRDEIKYNGKDTTILFLDENGFYSYTFDEQSLAVEFLYTTYDSFEATKLGEDALHTKIINSFFGSGCFWFRIDDVSTDEFGQVYYCWNIADKTGEIVDDVDESYEYSVDNNRTQAYSFHYKQASFNRALEITDNDTGAKKVIDKSILITFEEGKEIIKFKSTTTFGVEQAYVVGEDIFFVCGFGVGFLSEPHYYYIVKWNFNTEECTFVTSVNFDYFQEWVDDVIIVNQ